MGGSARQNPGGDRYSASRMKGGWMEVGRGVKVSGLDAVASEATLCGCGPREVWKSKE